MNLCIDRLPQGQSLLRPESHCDACGRRLRWFELVPVASILALRGRCRTCCFPIPWRVLAVEVISAITFGYLGLRYGVSGEGLALAVYAMVFVAIFFIDLEQGIIPDRLVYPASAAALGLSLLIPQVGFWRAVLGASVGFGIMLAVYLASRGGMGAGDVKFAGLIGLAVGFPLVLPALVLACMAGGGVAALLLARRRKRGRDAIPFGPFLAGGAITSLLWGQPLMHQWSGLFWGGTL